MIDPQTHAIGHLRGFPALILVGCCVLVLATCSSSSPFGGSGGSSGSGTGGSLAGAGGSRFSTGGNSGTGGSTTGNGGSSAGSGGALATSGVTGAGGSTPGSGGSRTGTGGSTAGSGGATGGSGGVTGSGGSASGGHGGANTGSGGANAGAGGSATVTGGSTGGGGATAGCPANATFCSGFETNALPSGAVYKVNAGPGDWSRDFGVDTSQKHSGSSSLLVKNQNASGSSGSAYRMLAVPVPPSGPFWVRFFVESDMPMGGVDHNAFAGTSDSTDPNGILDAFCEDVGIAFNTMDSDVTWPAGYGRLSGGGTKPFTIPAMTWKCVELSYDVTTRHQQLYVDGTLLIDASNYPPSASYSGSSFAAFKFGFDAFHGPPRQMWYDDVVVAPARIGCQ